MATCERRVCELLEMRKGYLATTELETVDVNAAKAERISNMTYAEIKALS